MVRLQPFTTRKLSITGQLVSIPLWFDYNSEQQRLLSFTQRSLNSTMVRLQPCQGRRQGHQRQLSQFHYGSITTHTEEVCVKFRLKVSIPLWFDYNTVAKSEYKTNDGSQFHYGSITTFIAEKELINDFEGLNSTMVRLQLERYDEKDPQKTLSQFHYGSITTIFIEPN